MINVVYTQNPLKETALSLTNALKKRLSAGERVLWLLTGGSGATIAVHVAKELQNINLSNLSVSMTDERYGPIGHADENWQQLLDSNLELRGATLYRPLIGADRHTTTTAFATWITQQLKAADYKVALFGVGPDGHTAGIKSHSPAVDSKDFATSFAGDDFERITITFSTIRQLDEAFIQASGDDKQAVIHDLLHATSSLVDQPAQILKEIPTTSLYTNIKKEGLV